MSDDSGAVLRLPTGYDKLYIWEPGDAVFVGDKQAVIKSVLGNNVYEIAYADPSLGKEMIKGSLLRGAAIELPYFTGSKCECGSSAVGIEKHSDYCPKYRRE